MITSPLTGGKTTLIKHISTDKIIALYQPLASVDRFFNDLKQVSIFECSDTGYQFYYPYTTAGDSLFYEELSKEILYYIPWKGEHEITESYVNHGDKVLELGCANGDFLLGLQRRKNIQAFGTELNDTARRTAEARGISFQKATQCDVTCAFQVLEHISDVQTFIADAIGATKPNGYIIFGVPDNDSFIKDDPACYLNMPPHHMGLWTESALRNVPNFFPVTVKKIYKEHLQPQHYRYFYQVRFGNHLLRIGLFGKIINKIIYEIFARPLIALRARRITGHTIVAVYQKK